ncbi:hypothetical protein [Pseudorhodoferax sp.]|uniref:hypothetical protein n=1 Tax=Pseudorhodoferax sp. TaxID=1993553 RepID=UPI0039E3C0A7
MYGLYETYDEYVSGVKTMFGDGPFRIPGREALHISGTQLGQSIAADTSREDFEAYKEYERNRQFMSDFKTSAQRWVALVNLSREMDAVLSANLPVQLLTPKSLLNAELFRAQLRLRANQGSSHVAVGIWMDEVLCAPRLRSVTDVLRLREDKRITSFRSAMAEWTSCLAGGSPAEEARLRKLVGTANKEVAKLKNVERMAAFFTFACVPLDLLLGLYPFTSLPVTSLVGATVLAATNHRKSQVDWVMFGSA